jgi:hypothetical protein
METKIEYQLSSEMAENLAVEQATIAFSRLSSKLWQLPIPFGILFAYIFALTSGSMIGYFVGFCFGYGIVWMLQAKWLNRLKKQARANSEKSGTNRIVSWDSESLQIASDSWKTEIKWNLVEQVTNGKIGIYIRSGERYIFGLPKTALSPNLTADELTTDWQNCFCKPPKLS